MTRKNPFVLEIGMLAFCKLVVTTPLHKPVGNVPVRSTTNGEVPPIQLRFKFVSERVKPSEIVCDTATNTAS